ncbi:hypothetical protein GCM10009133_04750 [Cocleimonas flava]|uniref:Lipoprotein n=1 Tax=Cocleimonas flava TaxID=634765 RepID=A0A4R1F2V0_9GAMM|nr:MULTISPECIES: hypothetical protein [Cocleimonas]MEB8432292.1 hypothetical protein [Cocleimonas sp. KMM 6892]MEC4714622.1 hypothetical protein [Cocleimonas sp. KMM 6895]MEC4744564.1 hypothetical protein [Cocleimonas sp. KMM 6896]TCJ86844.1 hypothetical protein EV695_1342 [Cocleimonas flava]
MKLSKIGTFTATTLICSTVLLAGCDQTKSATADLDRVLGVASDSMTKFEGTEDVNKDNVMEKFSSTYQSNLNSAQPPLLPGTIGVTPAKDGSLLSFEDKNNNNIQDEGEPDLFKLEVDSENNRLVASSQEEVRESGFSGTGLLMGMLIGNMLSRQRATGANPAAKRATPRKAAPSAKSRAGSGSHSRGK